MVKRVLALALGLILLAGCAPQALDGGKTHILCTTYPVYLFTTAVTQGAGDVEVELLVNQQTSCLHDYTLTVEDMKAVDRADIIVMSGGGLEEFLADALAQKDVPVTDCSEGIHLLPTLEHAGHDGHDHREEFDPHYWMDPRRAAVAVQTIADSLSDLDSRQSRLYQANATVACVQDLGGMAQDADEAQVMTARVTGGYLYLSDVCASTDLIPFHDGFQYFADAFGLELVKSIEEEEGSEASARELEEIIGLVKAYQIPAIFVEKNGSRRSADVIARETGCEVYELDMIMSGDGEGMEPYIRAMEENLTNLWEGLR